MITANETPKLEHVRYQLIVQIQAISQKIQEYKLKLSRLQEEDSFDMALAKARLQVGLIKQKSEKKALLRFLKNNFNV